jgi:hypothetical protein
MFPSIPKSVKWSHPSRFKSRSLYAFLISSMRPTQMPHSFHPPWIARPNWNKVIKFPNRAVKYVISTCSNLTSNVNKCVVPNRLQYERTTKTQADNEIFLLTTASRQALGPTQPPIHCVTRDLSLGVKRPGHEADHSPPSCAEVKECVKLYLHSPLCLLHGEALS